LAKPVYVYNTSNTLVTFENKLFYLLTIEVIMSKPIQFKSLLEEMPHSNVYNRHIKLPSEVYEQWMRKNKEKRILWSVNNGKNTPLL
jgi:hypothetical protein